MSIFTKIGFITSLLFLVGTAAHGALGYPDCPESHCSKRKDNINDACVKAGMGGKPFPVVSPDGSVCTCPCSCVVPNTYLSLAGGSDQFISNLLEGSELSLPYAGDATVDRMMRSEITDGQVHTLTFSNGRILVTSPNHTLVRPDESIVAVEDADAGTEVLDQDGNIVSVMGNKTSTYTGDLYNVIVKSKSPKASDHIVVTEGIQSGDWLLQAANDGMEAEITLRMENIPLYPLEGEGE